MNDDELQEFYERNKDDFVVIKIYGQETEITLKNFIEMVRSVDIREDDELEC